MQIPQSHAELLHRLGNYTPWDRLSRFESEMYLGQQLVTYQLLSLYQTLFPHAYATSTASAYERDNPEGHTHLELEFLRRLEQVIPVSEWTLEQATDSCLEGFPVLDMGIDFYEEDGIERLFPSIQILLPLSHQGRHYLQHFDGQQWYKAEFGLDLKQIQHPDRVPLARLRQRFNQCQPPLRFVPLLLSMLDKTTGNLWLDCTNNEEWFGSDCNTLFRWTEPNLRLLMRQWQQAERLHHHCNALKDWLRKSLIPRFQQILDLWNQPYH